MGDYIGNMPEDFNPLSSYGFRGYEFEAREFELDEGLKFYDLRVGRASELMRRRSR